MSKERFQNFGKKWYIENCLQFHTYLYPILASVVCLGQDFVKIVGGPKDFIHDRTSLVLFISILVSLITTTVFTLCLQYGIKKRSLRHLNIYIVIYFTLFYLNSTLHILKDNQSVRERLGNYFSIFYFVSLVYYGFFLFDGTNLFCFRDKLQTENGFPSPVKLFGVGLAKCMYPHLVIVLIVGVREVVIHSLIVKDLEEEFRRDLLPFLIIMIVINVSMVLITAMLYYGIRKRDPIWIWRYRFAKILLTFPSALNWTSMSWQWYRLLQKSVLDLQTQLYPLFAATAFMLELLLLHSYLRRFRNELDEPVEGNLVQSELEGAFEFLDRFLRSEKIPKMRVQLDSGSDGYLGKGQFGEVSKGKLIDSLKNCDVAVKFLKSDFYSRETLASIVSEIKTLNIAGSGNENLLKFYGVMRSKSAGFEIGIVMDYCSFGSLNAVLRHRREEDEFPDNIGNEELVKLERWSLQIASAMEFLGSVNVVHGDLATRNILLDDKECAKVTDFGMSLRLYNYQNYARSNQSVFPWRWMAPESLTDLKFSPKSDVWSYGVLLWELYTFGEIPWNKMQWTSDFVQNLQAGKRLEKPALSSDELYSKLICLCLSVNESERPEFKEIVTYFTSSA